MFLNKRHIWVVNTFWTKKIGEYSRSIRSNNGLLLSMIWSPCPFDIDGVRGLWCDISIGLVQIIQTKETFCTFSFDSFNILRNLMMSAMHPHIPYLKQNVHQIIVPTGNEGEGFLPQQQYYFIRNQVQQSAVFRYSKRSDANNYDGWWRKKKTNDTDMYG